MLPFLPLDCSFDIPYARAGITQYNHGIYSFAYGTTEEERSRIVYETFYIPTPGHNSVFRRQYLQVKLELLKSEWLRRHKYFLDPSNLPAESKNAQPCCAVACPAAHSEEAHHKNAIDCEWEQTAADAYIKFASLLNDYVRLEKLGKPITGYTMRNPNVDFERITVPLEIFALPNVPGPDLPPSGKLDFNLAPQDQLSPLTPDSASLGKLLQFAPRVFMEANEALIDKWERQNRGEKPEAGGWLRRFQTMIGWSSPPAQPAKQPEKYGLKVVVERKKLREPQDS